MINHINPMQDKCNGLVQLCSSQSVDVHTTPNFWAEDIVFGSKVWDVWTMHEERQDQALLTFGEWNESYNNTGWDKNVDRLGRGWGSGMNLSDPGSGMNLTPGQIWLWPQIAICVRLTAIFMMASLYDSVEYTNRRMAWRPSSALFALDSKHSIDMDRFASCSEAERRWLATTADAWEGRRYLGGQGIISLTTIYILILPLWEESRIITNMGWGDANNLITHYICCGDNFDRWNLANHIFVMLCDMISQGVCVVGHGE